MRAQGQGWNLAETALWLSILGELPPLPPEVLQRLPAPHRAHVSGAWREAAAAWAQLGCPYEQALALSAGDEGSQREALALFDRLGAAAAAARLRRQMRAGGARAIPRGPIAKTRASPAGLTRRQSEVFALLVKGLSNAQIARRLSIAPKTAEHHVSAIMARIGVTTRAEAAAAARARGLLDSARNLGDTPPQRWVPLPHARPPCPDHPAGSPNSCAEAVMKRIVIFVYGVLCYALSLVAFVYAVGFIGGFLAPTLLDAAPNRPLAQALGIDLALLAVFALQHSGMARPAFKRWWTRIVPEAAERSTYVLLELARRRRVLRLLAADRRR